MADFVPSYFDERTGRARVSGTGRFLSNLAARGSFLIDQLESEAVDRFGHAAETISYDYGGSEDEARGRIAEWYARREEGTPDDENPFPSP